jgi:hypothetical protein
MYTFLLKPSLGGTIVRMCAAPRVIVIPRLYARAPSTSNTAANSTDCVQLACATRTTAGARLDCNPCLTASLLFPALGVDSHHDEPKLQRNLSERGGAGDQREQASRNRR